MYFRLSSSTNKTHLSYLCTHQEDSRHPYASCSFLAFFNFAHTHSANGARLYHFLRRIASCLFIFRPLVLRTAPGGFGLSRCAQYGLRSVFLARQNALPYSEYLISFHFASAHVTPSSATVGVDVPPFFLLALSVSVHFSVGILLKE